MKLSTPLLLLLSCAAAAPWMLSLDPAGDPVAFRPVEGSSCTKTFTLKQEWAEGSLKLSNSGKELTVELTGHTSQSITIDDTYTKLNGPKPVQLSRTFRDGITEIDAGSTFAFRDTEEAYQATGEGDSRLNGLTVYFAWDAEQGEYGKAFDKKSEGEASWLPGLREDMDLRGFLPSGPVNVDEEWNADPAVLLATFVPGGDLQWNLELDDEGQPHGVDPAMYSELGPMLKDAEIDGEILCRYVGLKEVEGVEYPSIEIAVEVDAFTDLSERAEEEIDGEDLPDGMGMELGEMAMELHLEGAGILLWDAKEGHLHAFTYAGKTAMRFNRVVSITGRGRVIENAIRMEVDGTLELEVTTE